MNHHNQEHGHNQGHGLQGNHRQTGESAITNLPSASFEDQMYDMQQAHLGMDMIRRPCLEPTCEFLGQAHPQAAFDLHAWQGPPEISYGTGLSVPLALLSAEDQLTALLNAPIPVDPPINVNTFSDANVQTSQAQLFHSGDVDTSAELIPGLIPAGDVPNTIGASSRSSGIAGRPISILDQTMNSNPRGAWANPLPHHNNTEVPRGWTNRDDGPARGVIDIDIMSLRLRGVRLPPQTYEKDVLKLYDRLIYEGANSRAAVILRDVIFAAEVTHVALMAPIQKREISIEYGGAKRMWQLLLETKEVVPGKVKYSCLLCPLGGCREYNHDRDAVRHFNREHFGFTFPCEHW